MTIGITAMAQFAIMLNYPKFWLICLSEPDFELNQQVRAGLSLTVPDKSLWVILFMYSSRRLRPDHC